MPFSRSLFKLSCKINRKAVPIALVLLVLIFPMFFVNSRAQVPQDLYLNRVGFLNIEVGYDIHVVGDYVYVTNNDGLMIIDIQNPQNPQKVGELLSGGALGLKVENNIAYIASTPSGFVIANISNPSNPQLLGQDSVGGQSELQFQVRVLM